MARPLLLVIIAALLAMQSLQARELNGFKLDDASVPPAEIQHGGPPRDGIPALNNPKFVTEGQADFLKPKDRVLGGAG